MKSALMLIGAFGLVPLCAFAAGSGVVFRHADKSTMAVVAKLLGGEIREAESLSDDSPTVLTSSQRVSNAPFLFVTFRDRFHCGAANCSVWGFEQTKVGWRKVFESDGEEWAVLRREVSGHRDIASTRHDSATDNPTTTFRWDGKEYRAR